MNLADLNLTPDQIEQLRSVLAPAGTSWRTPDVSIPGGVFYNPASPEAREHAKWESTHTKWGEPGRPPYVYKPFPAMLYRPSRLDNGRVGMEQQVVQNDHEQAVYEGRGFVAGGPGKALEALEARERQIATAAAERAAAERRMSPRAREEAEAIDDATASHVPEIPETPVKRKGWPKGKKRATPDLVTAGGE